MDLRHRWGVFIGSLSRLSLEQEEMDLRGSIGNPKPHWQVQELQPRCKLLRERTDLPVRTEQQSVGLD